MNILFICTGNTCRSPMAEALIKHKYPEAQVQSAGIYANGGERASMSTIEVLKERGIDLNHVSQPVTERLLHWADLVLTMTSSHKQALMLEYPIFLEKYFTLKEYANDADKEVWEAMKKSYTELELKRAAFIQENSQKVDYVKLHEMLNDYLRDDLREIRLLEADLINDDISDPFGGELSVYQKTLAELDDQIDLLIDKLKRQS